MYIILLHINWWIPSNQGKDLEENCRYNFENRLPGNLTWLAIKWTVKFTIVLIENPEGLFMWIGPTSIVRMQCTCTQNRGYYFFLHLHMLPQCKQTGFSDFEKKGFRENGFLQYFSVSLSKNYYLIQIPEDLIYWKVEYRHVRITGYVHYCRYQHWVESCTRVK